MRIRTEVVVPVHSQPISDSDGAVYNVYRDLIMYSRSTPKSVTLLKTVNLELPDTSAKKINDRQKIVKQDTYTKVTTMLSSKELTIEILTKNKQLIY